MSSLNFLKVKKLPLSDFGLLEALKWSLKAKMFVVFKRSNTVSLSTKTRKHMKGNMGT